MKVGLINIRKVLIVTIQKDLVKYYDADLEKNEIEIPSPSRKMVKKMKKKGHTSVPYGSGYKKVNENKKTIDSVHKIL